MDIIHHRKSINEHKSGTMTTFNNTDGSTKYRIGFLGPLRLPPNLEGLLYNLGRMLGERFDLHVALGKGGDAGWIHDYYRVHLYSARMFDRAEILTSLKACRQFVKNVRPHLLINIINPASSGFAVAAVGQKHNITSVVRMCGHSFEEATAHQRLWKRFKSHLLHDKIAWTAYRKAEHILTVGEKLKEALVVRGIDPGRISVLPQPVDTDRFKPVPDNEKRDRKAALDLIPERKTILYTGRLSWLKGADRLLKVISLVAAQSRLFQFCLIGQGEFGRRFKSFPGELVHLTGYVPHRKVADYYQAADLLVLPSRTEGLPNAVLEALACRVPVIATPVGDIPNWVSHLATEPAEYADYILQGAWQCDNLPDFMAFDRLQEAYVKLFHDVVTGKMPP